MKEYRISYVYCNQDGTSKTSTADYVKAESERDAKDTIKTKLASKAKKVHEWRTIEGK